MPKKKENRGNTAESAATGLALPDVPLDAVLSFLKDTRGAVNWKTETLKDCLKLDAKGTEQILRILEMQGYVHREGEQWLTTSAGESVAKSKEPRLSLAKVTEALEVLQERIAAVNRDRRSEFKVSKAVAFGDFLSGRPKVQAADVGVELMRRNPATAAGADEDSEEAKQKLLKELGRGSRFVSLQLYRNWMSRRTHRSLT